ncbi:MAG: beta-ketoacyl reductase, partial [Trebonia sp.]
KGVPATSLAWGTWAAGSGLIDLIPSDHARIACREGLLPLGSARALALYDEALRMAYPHILPVRFSSASLRAKVSDDALCSVSEGPASRGHAASPGRPALPAVIPETGQGPRAGAFDHAQTILDLVLTQAAIVLEHLGPDAIDAARPFRDLGFDSMSCLELTQRLSASTGLRLPSLLLDDYSTPAALAALVRTRVQQSEYTVLT